MEIGDNRYRAGKKLHETRIGLAEELADLQADQEIESTEDRSQKIDGLIKQIATIDGKEVYTEFLALEAETPSEPMTADLTRAAVDAKKHQNLVVMESTLVDYIVQQLSFPDCDTNLPSPLGVKGHPKIPLHPELKVPLDVPMCPKCNWEKKVDDMAAAIRALKASDVNKILSRLIG